MKVSSRIEVEGDHNFLVGEASIDKLDCSDRELDFWDMSLSGSLALELGSLGGDFDMVDPGLETQRRCSVARLHVSTVGSNTLVGRWNLVWWRMIG